MRRGGIDAISEQDRMRRMVHEVGQPSTMIELDLRGSRTKWIVRADGWKSDWRCQRRHLGAICRAGHLALESIEQRVVGADEMFHLLKMYWIYGTWERVTLQWSRGWRRWWRVMAGRWSRRDRRCGRRGTKIGSRGIVGRSTHGRWPGRSWNANDHRWLWRQTRVSG